ncbi:MAG: hypothetical protein JJU16_03700 [Alkalibacterium sp.]|nr:hypothetical protein [Alkalibacterium sp.]
MPNKDKVFPFNFDPEDKNEFINAEETSDLEPDHPSDADKADDLSEDDFDSFDVDKVDDLEKSKDDNARKDD